MARYFPGARSAYLKCETGEDLEFYPCTMVAWEKYDGTAPGGSGTVFARHYPNATGGAVIEDDSLRTLTSNGTPRIECARPGAFALLQASSGDTNWHHMALVMRSNADRDFYLDGAFISNSVTAVPSAAGRITALGCGATELLNAPVDKGGLVYKGAVADCAIWTSELTATEIAALAAKQVRPAHVQSANLKGFWPFTLGGDLESHSVAYLPFTQFGAVTEAADPPDLPLFECPTTVSLTADYRLQFV